MVAAKEMEAKIVTLDDVLSKFSIYGRYHMSLGLCMFVAFTITGNFCINYVFAAEAIKFRCKNSSQHCDVTSANSSFNAVEDQCYERVSIDGSCGLNSSKLVPCTEWDYDVPDSLVGEFDLACREWKRTILGTIHMAGYMCGLLIVGPLSDRFGRKWVIVATGLCGGLIGFCRSFSQNYLLYLVLEFLEPFGDLFSPCFMLIMEVVPPNQRVKFLMLIQLGCQIANLLMTANAWMFHYWRNYLRAMYAPAVLFVTFSYFLEESPRWLLAKGRKDEAIEILQRAADRSKVIINKDVLESLPCGEEVKKISMQELLRETFQSRILLTRFLTCVVWWTTSTFVWYGMTINSVSLNGNKFINFTLMGLVDLPANLFSSYLMIYFKRKKPLLASFFGAAVFFLIQPFLPSNLAWLSMIFLLLGKLIGTVFFNITYVFTSELFPTYTRNSMHALCSSVGRIGAILAPQTPLLLPFWSGLPSCLFGGMSLFAALVTLTVPDTADDALPDCVKQAEAVGAGSTQTCA